VKYSYQVNYRNGRTGVTGFMVLPTAEKAEDEKCRLERFGLIVTSIVPPAGDGLKPPVSASPI
jgi:hypothetical protein